jgi:hypothetical protein
VGAGEVATRARVLSSKLRERVWKRYVLATFCGVSQLSRAAKKQPGEERKAKRSTHGSKDTEGLSRVKKSRRSRSSAGAGFRTALHSAVPRRGRLCAALARSPPLKHPDDACCDALPAKAHAALAFTGAVT